MKPSDIRVAVSRPYQVRFVDTDEIARVLQGVDAVISDHNVLRHWKGVVPPRTPLFSLEPGEESKSIGVYEKTLCFLADTGLLRNSRLAALGGGVVGDLAGFVAATYMRGIEYVQIPTTLLAMVDSSVGGKVGIDLPQGKNLVGSFMQPSEVLVSEQFLSTLPENRLIEGYAEAIKMGYAVSPAILELMESGDAEAMIGACVQAKARIVEQDEFDTSGIRAALNFGHTVAHAIETLSRFSISHGEAVAMGMLYEAKLGERIGVTPRGIGLRILRDVQRVGLPERRPAMLSAQDMLEAMRLDKKAIAGGLSFSLISGMGECKLTTGVSTSEVLAALDEDN